MSKKEFLDQLSDLLYDLSPEDKDEALSYYQEYIEDAGLENEAAILAELGSVEELAAEIKAGLSNRDDAEGSTRPFRAPQPRQSAGNTSANTTTDSRSKIILIVIALILLSPIWLPLAGSLLSVLLCILVAIAAVLFCFGIVGVILAVVSIALFVIGVISLLGNPIAGLAQIGASCLLASLAIIFLLLAGSIFGKLFPWIFNGISRLTYAIFHHSKEVTK